MEKDEKQDIDNIVFSEKSGKKRSGKTSSGWEYMGYAGQVGYSVALPIIIGTVGGKYIDDRTGTGTKFTLIGLALGSLLSVLAFVGLIREIIGKKQK